MLNCCLHFSFIMAVRLVTCANDLKMPKNIIYTRKLLKKKKIGGGGALSYYLSNET